MNDQELMRAIGRLEGELIGIKKGVESNSRKLQRLDDRLRKEEIRSAAAGGLAGTVAGLIVTFGAELLKALR